MILDDDFDILKRINESADKIRYLKRDIKQFIYWKSSQMNTIYCGIQFMGVSPMRKFEASEKLTERVIKYDQFITQVQKENNVNYYTAKKIVLNSIVEDLYEQVKSWIVNEDVDITELKVDYKYGKEWWYDSRY